MAELEQVKVTDKPESVKGYLEANVYPYMQTALLEVLLILLASC